MLITSSVLDILDNLPGELQVKVLKYLTPLDLCIASTVSRAWNTIAQDYAIWKKKSYELWPNADGKQLSWKRYYQLHHQYRKPTQLLFAHEHFLVGYNNNIFVWVNQFPYRLALNPHISTDHLAPITALLKCGFSPENHRIITGSADGTVRLWKEEDRIPHVAGQHQKDLVCRHILLGHMDPITALLVRRKWIIAGSADNTISVWENDAVNEKVILHDILEKHTGEITALQSGQDDANGFIFYSASRDKTIRVWRINQDKQIKCLQTVKSNNERVTRLHMSGSDKYLYSGTTNNHILVWEINQMGILNLNKPVAILEGHTKPITCLHAIRFSIYFLSGSADGTVIIWKRDPQKNLWSIANEMLPPLSQAPVSQIYVKTTDPLRNSKKLFITYKNREIRIYNCAPMPSNIMLQQTLVFNKPED